MAHKFNPSHKEKLDNPKRREALPPYDTLKRLRLSEGDIIADIGCGIGYFTLSAAELSGPGGKVYALDISDEMLDETKKAAMEKGFTNIELVRNTEYDLVIGGESVTYCFISLVLHEVDDLKRYVEEIGRILRCGGRLAIIEWQKIVSDFGPPVDHRLDRVELIDLLESKGYLMEEQLELGVDYYAIVAVKEKN
ncbi:MAG TPA: class I SAM-dependent methyltransferase [Negativicutes bacterium]|nr:class I SAM-dependent methyltransferase [Negativicutes bacterium]